MFELEYAEFDIDLQNQEVLLETPDYGVFLRGSCHPDGKILINPDFFHYLKDADKELLVFHELAHCALGLSHEMSVLGHWDWQANKYCPTSLIHAGHRAFHVECYIQNKRYYLDSLKILKRTKILHGNK